MSDDTKHDENPRHICTKCGWFGRKSETVYAGGLRFCPRCPYMTKELPPDDPKEPVSP